MIEHDELINIGFNYIEDKIHDWTTHKYIDLSFYRYNYNDKVFINGKPKSKCLVIEYYPKNKLDHNNYPNLYCITNKIKPVGKLLCMTLYLGVKSEHIEPININEIIDYINKKKEELLKL